MNKKVLFIVAIVILLIGGIVFYSFFNTDQDDSVATVVTMDINPSVKISLDEDDVVISVKALNDDAATLVFDDVIGTDVETAVEMIVLKAKAAGYINEEDLEDDYVLITTVAMGKGQDKTDKVKEKIGNKIQTSDELQSLNVAIIKASKVEMLEAEGKKVPIGLYVVNGKITVDGEEMTVKAFFSKSENINKFKEKGTIIEKKAEKKREQLERYLIKLEADGFDILPYQSMLNAPDADLNAIISEIRKTVVESKKENKGNKPENKSNGNKKKE